MIVTPRELAFAESALENERTVLERLEDIDDYERDGIGEPLTAFFGRHPHLMLVLGFDEYAVLERPDVICKDPFHEVASPYGVDSTALVYDTESLYRSRKSGAWYIFDGLTDPGQFSPFEALHFLGAEHKAFAVEAWMRELAGLVEAADSSHRALWLRGCWTPVWQRQQRKALRGVVDPILAGLRAQTLDLRELHWRELEELVAELLASRGFEVDVTPRSGDGGRDVVARGEPVPGEPLQIAVEVKQKPVVGLADVQRALYANQAYPALMVATAGVFSAGAIEEKGREGNMMRLFLKDGVALEQWLNSL